MIFYHEKYYLDIDEYPDKSIYFEIIGDKDYARDIISREQLESITHNLEECCIDGPVCESFIICESFINPIHNSESMYFSIIWHKKDDEFVLSVSNKRTGVDFEIHLNKTEFKEFVENLLKVAK